MSFPASTLISKTFDFNLQLYMPDIHEFLLIYMHFLITLISQLTVLMSKNKKIETF